MRDGRLYDTMLTNPPVPLKFLRQCPNFMFSYRGVNACLAECLNSALNVKALVGAFNQEKALVGAFSMIVKPVVESMDTPQPALHNMFSCSPHSHQMEDNVGTLYGACSMCLPNNKMYLLFWLKNKKFDDKELIVYKRYNFYFLI